MILKKLGSIGVDSGQVFITDPCYIKHTEQGKPYLVIQDGDTIVQAEV